MTSFLQAATIVFREGLEAMLMIGAMVAYLRSQQSSPRLFPIAAGTGLALLATGLAILLFGEFSPLVENESFHGFVLLTAALLMLYVSGWLFSQQGTPSWQNYLRKHIRNGVIQKTDYLLVIVAFVAVFREVLESTLFLKALLIRTGDAGFGVAAGGLVAVALLIALSIFIFRTARRIRLRPIFLFSSALFFVTAIVFLGDALSYFQLLQYLPSTPVLNGQSTLKALGLNPTWEAIAIQFCTIALAVAFAFVAAMRKRDELENG